MRNRILSFLAIVVLVALAIATTSSGRPASAQLQQSGGTGSNASVGSINVAGPSSATQVGAQFNTTPATLTNGQMGALQLDSSQNLLVKVNAGAVSATQSGTWTVQPGNTANTTPWLVKMIPNTGCGATLYDSGVVVVPNSSTAVTTTTTCVDRVIFNNITGNAVTVTLQDNQGTPKDYLTSYSLPGNSQLVLPLGYAKFLSGIKWQAGTASAINAQIVGYQAP